MDWAGRFERANPSGLQKSAGRRTPVLVFLPDLNHPGRYPWALRAAGTKPSNARKGESLGKRPLVSEIYPWK